MRLLNRNRAVSPQPATLSNHGVRAMCFEEELARFDDLIVAEVRHARMEILESFGGDLEAMLRDVIRRQNERKQK